MKINISMSEGPKLVQNRYTGNNGIYVCAIPSLESKETIIQLAKQYDDTLEVDADKLHTTIMYSSKAPLVSSVDSLMENMPEDLLEGETEIDNISYHKGHDDRFYLVLNLNIMNLQNVHNMFNTIGAKHSYPEYNPHVTLWAYTDQSDIDESKLKIINHELRKNPVSIRYEVQYPSNLKS